MIFPYLIYLYFIYLYFIVRCFPYPGYPYPGFPYMALPYMVKAYLDLTAVQRPHNHGGSNAKTALLSVKITSVDFEQFICLYAVIASCMGKHPRPVQNARHRGKSRRFSTSFATFFREATEDY